MSDRPTPETDKYADADWWTLFRATEHARKLERERDAARTELEMWRDGNILHEIHRDELEKVERERDEARQALSKWENEKWCDECGHPLSQCGDQNDDGEPEMDCFRCRTLFILKEARAESARLLERIERERDEAREALEIATDQLVQAQAALREIHTIVQLRFAEWAPANDLNDGREEAAK